MDKIIGEGKIFTFDEILDRESLVLIDTSAINSKNLKLYKEIDSDILEKETFILDSLLDLLFNERVHTVPGVSLEVKLMRDVVQYRIRYLKSHEKFDEKSRRGRYPEKRSHVGREKQRALLSEIQSLIHRIYKQSTKSVFKPKRKNHYELLEQIVLTVTEKTGAKINYDFLYGDDKPKSVEDDPHTDEQLVSTAFYLASVESKECCILTRDSDIRRILINTLGYLSHSGLKGFNGISVLVDENRIRVYYMEGLEKATCSFDTIYFDPRIYVRKLTPKIIESLDRELRIL